MRIEELLICLGRGLTICRRPCIGHKLACLEGHLKGVLPPQCFQQSSEAIRSLLTCSPAHIARIRYMTHNSVSNTQICLIAPLLASLTSGRRVVTISAVILERGMFALCYLSAARPCNHNFERKHYSHGVDCNFGCQFQALFVTITLCSLADSNVPNHGVRGWSAHRGE